VQPERQGRGARVEVSVVVPVRDGAGTLPALLESLGAQTLERDRFEVIVVDNASRDATARIAAEYGARVVHEPVPNRSRARNRGVAAARGDLLAFTDADCVAEPGWLEGFLAVAERRPLMAGHVELTTGEPPNAVERFERLWRFGQEHWVRDGWAATANLAVERRAFDRVGGFDPAYRHYGEDADFCLRARRAGLELGWAARARVAHAGEARLGPMLRRAFFHGYGAVQCLRRIGIGERAWRHPRPLADGGAALRRFGADPAAMAPGEARSMRALARLAYASRVLGSLWAETA
jgi:glycosyltransferase involved in cell wall biosynthesis